MLTWFNSPLCWQNTNPRKKKGKKNPHKFLPGSWAESAEQKAAEMVPGMRGAQSWAQGKGRRTVPSGTRQLQGVLSCLTKTHLQPTFPTQVGSREKLPLLFPGLWAQRHRDELGAGCSFPKHENKGRHRCLSGLITAARHTCTLAFPLHELLYRLLPNYRNEFHLLSVFQRLLSLGNWRKKKWQCYCSHSLEQN